MTYERGRPRHPDLLTPAEQRVLEELREGRPNAEIAVRLGISVNTVRYHVSNMLGKLELPNRAALRSWDGKRRREWGWASMWGFRFDSGLSVAGKLALSVGVATVGAGLLVVGSGRVTLPSMVEEAPVAATVTSDGEMVEPQDVGAEVGTRLGRIYDRDGLLMGCVDVSISTVPVGSITPLTPGYLSDSGDPAPLVDNYLPVVRIDGVRAESDCRPIDLLKERSLADAFEVAVEAD